MGRLNRTAEAGMHHVQYVDGNWHIIDSDEQTVFIGNKQQVEEWLDVQETIA